MHRNGQPKPESDALASAAFQRWKDANHPFSDGEIAKVVRCTAGSVVNWRKGTRPDARFLKNLESLIGFQWDNPPAEDAVGRLLTESEKDKYKTLPSVSLEERKRNRLGTSPAKVAKPKVVKPKVVKPEVVPTVHTEPAVEPLAAKAPKARKVRKASVLPVLPSLSEDVDLLVARGTFASALAGGKDLDLSVPSVASAIRVAQRLIEREFDARKTEPKMMYLRDMLPIVLGHRDPRGTLEALRRLNIGNVEPSVWDAIGNLIEPEVAVPATAK